MVLYIVINSAGTRKLNCFSVLSVTGASKTEFDWRSVRLVCSPFDRWPLTIPGYKIGRRKSLSMVGTWDSHKIWLMTALRPLLRRRERARHTHTGPKNDVNTFTGRLPCNSDVSCLKARIAHFPAVQSDMTALKRPTSVTTLYTTEHWDRGFDTRSVRACQPMLAVFCVGRADVHGVQ